MYHCEIKPKSIGECSFLKGFQSGWASVLRDFICVQVAVLVIGMFAIETIQR